MTWWMWVLIGIYVGGFAITMHYHAVMAPNATISLALLRCMVWPIFWAFGWPHGSLIMPID